MGAHFQMLLPLPGRPSSAHMPSTFATTSSDIRISVPHSRFVSGGHLVGRDGSILHTFDGNSAADVFGWSVSGAGDVNRDGFADLIVGALNDDTSGIATGSARVLSGAWIASGIPPEILYTFYGDSVGEVFGGSVSGAGDVNGDGYCDLIVGAPLDGANGTDSGSARVLSGMDGSILHAFDGDSQGDWFGLSVSGPRKR